MSMHLSSAPPRRSATIAEPATHRLSGIGLTLCLTLALGWSLTPRGANAKDSVEGSAKYLPAYCQLALKGKAATPAELATLRNFERRVGCTGELHLYCAALGRLLETTGAKPSKPRDDQLAKAIGELGATLSGCENPRAPLKPEILTNLGRAFISLVQYENAVRVLTEAIARNPKYEAAYAELSTVYLSLNNKDDARKILEDGLKQAPDSKLLKLRLARLGAAEPQAAEEKAPEQ